MKSDDAAELRKRLSDAQALCLALDLFPRGQRKPSKAGRGGWLVRCPWCNRGSDTPPCSVSPGPDRTLRAKCFSCGATGDALSLIAAVHGLDLRADFPAVLGEAARLVGVTLEASRRPFPSADVGPLTYPEASEVAALWEEAYPLEADDEARAYLDEVRKIDPGNVDLYDLARVVQPWASAPSWARCRGRSWASTHRLILPVVDRLLPAVRRAAQRRGRRHFPGGVMPTPCGPFNPQKGTNPTAHALEKLANGAENRHEA